ncbi:vascular endothelial growth factor receptor 1 isoform X2 [Bombyx mandarina]|uniref:Hemolin n=1 Tax=Bombyx mandarina TaxID=7092 RepID=A0A6J2KFZ7_BOMMA|nr:vascular endothelial growth factor receptor 1 isoform X2 [Bombyx mandarina]
MHAVGIKVTKMTSFNVLLFICVTGLISVTTTNADNCTDFHPNGPKITPCKSEFILHKGQNFSLTCRGKNPLEFKQQETPEELPKNKPIKTMRQTSDSEYPFETIINIYNVDEYAIGYYACFDDVKTNFTLNNLIEEPRNTENASFIYIYVEGSDSLIAPMREIVVPRDCSKIVIECRPTTPDVNVTLSSPTSRENQESIKYYPKIGFVMSSCGRSGFNCTGQRGNQSKWKLIRNIKKPPKPKVAGGHKQFLEGETFTIHCRVPNDGLINFKWKYPPEVTNDSVEVSVVKTEATTTGSIVYQNITIRNATKKHNGVYTCLLTNTCGEEKDEFRKIFLETPFLSLRDLAKGKLMGNANRSINIVIEIEAYPPVERTHFLKNDKYLPSNDLKYNVTTLANGDPKLRINDLKLTDIANYTLVAENKYLTKNYTVDLRVFTKPEAKLLNNRIIKRLENSEMNFACKVTGYPLPDVTWIFSNDEEHELSSTKSEQESLYAKTDYLKISVQASGVITCNAHNSKGEYFDSSTLLVYEINNGFGILQPLENWYSEKDSARKKCLASVYDYDNVSWLGSDGNILDDIVEYSNSTFSHIATLTLDPISMEHTGTYICRGLRKNSTEADFQNITITVAELLAPIIREPDSNKDEEAMEGRSIQLHCEAEGVPRPTIYWYKDDELISNNSGYKLFVDIVNHTIVNSTFEIENMQEKDNGIYECVALNNASELRRAYTLVLKAEKSYTPYVIVTAVIILVLLGMVAYLFTWKLKKQRELTKAGLLNFKSGNKKSFNPNLGIDEQADLLPYDEKFEFPREKLTFGKQLGAGAFGVVYKAEARGIINAEVTTPVAVKMVKRTADNMYIKALASELKIMVHLGKHVNIVNLLGACTKHIAKRELIVIVEYCKYGNIHNYMQKHREVFIDQLTDNAEKNLGKINKGFLNSVGTTGTHSDYFSSGNTKDTDHSLLDSGNSKRSGRKVSEGYIQQEWQTKYEGDYIYECHQPRPLTSGHLLGWAFQIARGMEYLANRKVLHGDLAARNVLLADDNVVKICDFGLARSMYNNEEYQKKENSPLPVKWLAIECMVDRIFSTQSDVWSYGIVLWEMFSLAKTPYPNISPTDLLRWLSDGNRLEKPPFADDRLYNVMLRCWHQKPTARPSFTELQEILGNFLEDNERNRYVDLNAPYNEMNAELMTGEDYLAMVCAPDYNNIVTPSPNYVNMAKSFFPATPTPKDQEGYLPMSPTSDQTKYMAHGTKFDFDSRKLNPRVSEASNVGSVITPLLDLNNLPARSGSESDHENNASTYLDKCIDDKKSDEVFEMKQTNTKNPQDNSAVTNPTYYTFDVENEKKPKEITNPYVNFANGSTVHLK